MIDLGVLVVSIGGLIFAAHFFAWLFSHTKIPDALLLIVVGMVVGPLAGWLTPAFFGDSGNLLVMLVLVVLLFQSGLDLRWRVLKEAWGGTIRLTLLSFAGVMALVGGVLWLMFSLPPLVAFMAGAIVGGTSSAIVIPLLKHLTVSEEVKTTLTLESVVSDVLAIMITIALLEAYRVGSFDAGGVASDILLSFSGAVVLGALAALAWSRLLLTVHHIKNSLFMTPALVFILFGIAEQLGLSGAVAALAFGVMIGNIPHVNEWLERRHPWFRYVFWLAPISRREKVVFGELVFLLQTFFFVFVGLSLDFAGVQPLVIGLSLVVMMGILRPIVVALTVPRDTAPHDATVMSVVIPKGLAAAALATLPLQQGVVRAELIQETTYAIIFFSVLITSLLVFAVYRSRLVKDYQDFFRGIWRVKSSGGKP